jgi:hypothetical protein
VPNLGNYPSFNLFVLSAFWDGINFRTTISCYISLSRLERKKCEIKKKRSSLCVASAVSGSDPLNPRIASKVLSQALPITQQRAALERPCLMTIDSNPLTAVCVVVPKSSYFDVKKIYGTSPSSSFAAAAAPLTLADMRVVRSFSQHKSCKLFS